MRLILMLLISPVLPFTITVSFIAFCCTKGQTAYNALGAGIISLLILFWILRYEGKS